MSKRKNDQPAKNDSPGARKRRQQQRKLMSALNFNEYSLDLMLNSPSVVARNSRIQRQLSKAVGGGFGLVLIAFALWFELKIPVLGLLLLILLVVFVAASIAYLAQPAETPVQHQSVESVEGPLLRLHDTDETGQDRFRLKIVDAEFEVSKDVYAAFDMNAAYRLYYTLDTHDIVAAEVLIPG
jgi:hypothetical protein